MIHDPQRTDFYEAAIGKERADYLTNGWKRSYLTGGMPSATLPFASSSTRWVQSSGAGGCGRLLIISGCDLGVTCIVRYPTVLCGIALEANPRKTL